MNEVQRRGDRSKNMAVGERKEKAWKIVCTILLNMATLRKG